jgi:hypothetical protein
MGSTARSPLSGRRSNLALSLALFVLVGSCERDQRSLTDVGRPPRATVTVTSPSTTTISPNGDTWLGLDAVSYASDTSLNVYTWPDNKIANAIVMKFDFAGIPAGSAITSATLNLYLDSSDATIDPTYTVTVHQIINKNADPTRATGYTYDGVNGWTPNTCCSNNVPLAQADISAPVDTKNVDKTIGFKQWDVTSIVQAWFSNPSSNFGLLVNSDPTKLRDRFRFFRSSEYANTGQRPYLTVVYTAPSSGVLFESSWTTALGATDAAIRDVNAPYGPWDAWEDGGLHLLSVVSGGPPGYANALQVQQESGPPVGPPGAYADVQKYRFVAANTDYYFRYYVKVSDMAQCVQDHGVEPWLWDQQYNDLVYLDKHEQASGWGFNLNIGDNATDGHGGNIYPIWHWYLVGQNAYPLAYDTWYRLEYWVHFTSPNHIQVHPRVYDAAGTLLYSDADFQQSDYGTGNSYHGFDDWTLALWYSRASQTGDPTYGDFEVNGSPDPAQTANGATTTLQSLVMGNNESSGCNPTGLYYYYAGVQIRSDTWPGP